MVEYKELGELATVKTNLEDADFWLVRVGNVGSPIREFSPSHIGIKLNSDGLKVIDPNFLWYQFVFLHGKGHWSRLEAKGSVIPFISVSSVKNFLVAVDSQ